MKKLLILLALFAVFTPAAFAQQRENVVVADCGDLSLKAGNSAFTYVDTQGRLCTSGTNGGATETTMAQLLSAMQDAVTALQGTLSAALVAAIPAGSNVIGGVTVPADPFGLNADAACTAGSTGSIQCKLRYITSRLSDLASAIEAIRDSTTPVNVLSWAGTLQQGKTAQMTGTTSTQVIAGVASNYLYITSCSMTNDHASVSTNITLQDGSGGTAITVPLSVTFGYGGREIRFPTPLKVPTLGNGLYAVNTVNGSSTYVGCRGFSSTVSY